MKVSLPTHWFEFIKNFTEKFEDEIVYDVVRIFRSKEDIEERYNTYHFKEFLPDYIPVADDSGGQVAVISKNENDTKVYLSSYGTLQKEMLEVLDRDLLHWMERKFPFDREQTVLPTQYKEEIMKKNEALFQQIISYPGIIQFLEKKVAIEGFMFPENYAVADRIYYFQDGYHYNSIEDKVLTGNNPGDFKPDWVVLAVNYFADPFFISLKEESMGFPVYFAYHGQGYWKPLKIAENLEIFQKIVDDTFSVRFDKKALSDYFSKYKDIENPFWEEVLEAIENNVETDEEATETNESDWRKANLYITDIGPNKMKIIALLKKEHKLSGSEALTLSKNARILFTTGYYKWLDYHYRQLEALGAKTEVEIIE